MINNSRVREIKHAQKESVITQKLAQFYVQIQQDEPKLQRLVLNRVKLTPDMRQCRVYFFSAQGLPAFEELRPLLVLYKPSIRHAIGQALRLRYVPDITFVYDAAYEKQERVDRLIDDLKEKGKL